METPEHPKLKYLRQFFDPTLLCDECDLREENLDRNAVVYEIEGEDRSLCETCYLAIAVGVDYE